MQAKVDTMPGAPAASSGGKPKAVKMAAKLAYRNLFHDRLSLAVTLTGIVFSVVLVAVQFGLYLGSERMIAAMLDHAKADLWVVPLGTKSFDDPSLADRPRDVTPCCRRRASPTSRSSIVGFVALAQAEGRLDRGAAGRLGHEQAARSPWNVAGGSVEALAAPIGVAIDDTYFTELGVNKLGDKAEVNNLEVTVTARHARHPLVHDAALRLHHPRHRPATLLDAATSRRPTRSSSWRRAPTAKTVRDGSRRTPAGREILTHDEFRQAQPRLLAVRDRSRLGADRRRDRSASSSASSSWRRRSTRAPRTT